LTLEPGETRIDRAHAWSYNTRFRERFHQLPKVFPSDVEHERLVGGLNRLIRWNEQIGPDIYKGFGPREGYNDSFLSLSRERCAFG
jgi:hypothetical protein